ncbi:MAG TPA: glycosyl hydrolase family 28 protein, partial [Bacteroidota bacterium]|nr:glycosyl hydrolase family 28 protein [Bacteroidota bacterium]
FANAPGWTLVPTRCEDIVMRNVTVNNPWWGQNTDGLDINSCRNMLLYNSVISAGDDAICLKPAKPNDAHASDPSCENIVVADCIVYHGHGGFVVGSETYGGARNISVKNCSFIGTDVGLRFKSSQGRGGVVEKVYVDGIRMIDIADEAILFDMFYDNSADIESGDGRVPEFRDFTISNIVCDGASDAIFIRGLADMPIKEIRFENLSIEADKSCFIENAEGIVVDGMHVSIKKGPVWTINNAHDIQLTKISCGQPADVYVRVSGEHSGNIVVEKTSLSAASHDIEMDKDVPSDAVRVK